MLVPCRRWQNVVRGLLENLSCGSAVLGRILHQQILEGLLKVSFPSIFAGEVRVPLDEQLCRSMGKLEHGLGRQGKAIGGFTGRIRG